MNLLQRFFIFYPLYILSLLPLQALYFFTAPLYFFLYYFPGYRKKISLQNLQTAFPEKTTKEIQHIQKENYKYICKLIAENIKSISISPKELTQRITLHNRALLEHYHKQGGSVLMLLGHQGNWEMIAQAASLVAPHTFIIVYKPLSSSFFDALLKRNRERFGALTCPMNQTPQMIQKSKSDKYMFTLVADQSPSNPNKSIWTSFLNQETAFLSGPEMLSKRYKLPVLFLDIKSYKSGYYDLYPKVILDNINDTTYPNVTSGYAKSLEKGIKNQAETWLWTHRRWKHKKM